MGRHARGRGLDGVVCEADAQTWHDWLDSANISWSAWKLDGCGDSSCLFKDRSAPVEGGWTEEWLNGHAPFVVEQMLNDMDTSGGSGGGGEGGSSNGGATSSGGAGAEAGSGAEGGAKAEAGTGGQSGSDDEPFPPDPAGCNLVVSCPSCCETAGVFALDYYSEDATEAYVQVFEVDDEGASANFVFDTRGEVGAIFFRLLSEEDIGSLGVTLAHSGGSLEIALVRGGGSDGCVYPVIGNSLHPDPSVCWGRGAGPYYGYPADQIEVRVRSSGPGSASLEIAEIEYGP